MALSPAARHRARYLVPLGAAVVTAGVVLVPQAASGVTHPHLPARTAAQLLAAMERAPLPHFSGTVVETARLGLPDIGDSQLAGDMTPAGHDGLTEIVTLLSGSHTAQVAYGGPDKQRLAIFLSDLSEMDVVHNGDDIWTYSSDSNSVTHNTLEGRAADHSAAKAPEPDVTTAMDPAKAAERALAEIDPSTAVTVDRTAEVAGRPAYQVDLTPRDANTLVGSVRIALDSATSLPLRVQIWSRDDASDPAFEVGFTSISMSAPSASTFDFTTPPTATTEPLPFSHSFAGSAEGGDSGTEAGGASVVGHNWTSVLVEHVAPPSAAAPGAPPQEPGLAQSLDQLGDRVAGGHVISTSLVTILVTDDNRILLGAVTPRYLEQLAASKAAQ
ncbi:MAG TPA: sigma-E factor regulatory protein RseB domain-containing protein [Mycobacteriales bacterium]|nr:sigma-E factor regulatory protein RseB domain-containing protein [Mycobacteriales bacterium]